MREGEIFSCKAQGCRGLDFPKFLIKAHHLPSFLCSFHHDGAINLSSLFVCHSAVVNLITCSCEGCWEGGRDGVRRRERETEGRGIGLKKGERELKKKKKYHRKLPRLKREKKKALSLLLYLSSSAHQRHKCLIFSLSHSSEMRSLSVTLVPLLPPSLYLCASIRQKHFDKVKHKPIVLGEERRGDKMRALTLPTSD